MVLSDCRHHMTFTYKLGLVGIPSYKLSGFVGSRFMHGVFYDLLTLLAWLLLSLRSWLPARCVIVEEIIYRDSRLVSYRCP